MRLYKCINIQGSDNVVNDFCPKCNTLTNMTVSTVEREENDNNGKAIKVTTTNYHCSMGYSFVQSQKERTPKIEEA